MIVAFILMIILAVIILSLVFNVHKARQLSKYEEINNSNKDYRNAFQEI